MKQVFASDRISFVQVSEALVGDYLKLMNDFENVQKYIRRVPVAHDPYTEEQEIDWVRKKLSDREQVFSMIEKGSGQFIGNTEWMNIENGEGELGIAIVGGKQDRGYGTEAVSAMIRYGMEQLHLKRLLLRANPENARAIHVYQKCGFREYRRTEDHVFMEIKP